MKTLFARLVLAGALALSLFTACADSETQVTQHPDSGISAPDAGSEPDCFANPTTNYEIINSCPPAGTTQIAKNPVLPLNADGTLPQLP